jgi:hypothetical protein
MRSATGCGAICARQVPVSAIASHGGAKYTAPTIVTAQVLDDLRALVPLAPLHQPHNVAAIDAFAARSPDVPQVACFDTSFHRGQPAVAELVPLPAAIRDRGVQRYGFHGLSYEYIAHTLPTAAPEIADGRVIVAHLGSGASLCALANRKSRDCSFGFTPLDGLCMGTRPGALDPGIVLYMLQTLGLSAKEIEATLYKKSGLLAFRYQQRHARLARERCTAGASRGRLFRLSRGQGDRRVRGRARGRRRSGIHGRHRRALGGNSGADLRRFGVARDRARREQQLEAWPAHLDGKEPCVGVGHSDQRRTDDCAAYRAVARPHRATSLNACASEEESMAATAPQKQPTRDEKIESPWRGFRSGLWQKEIDVRDFIQQNYEPYDGDESFLAPATERTKGIWRKLEALFVEERKKGVLDVSQIPSSITAHAPGYIDRDKELIVGLQTEAPLKRAICRTAVSGSCRARSRPMATSRTRTSSRRSRNTARRTTTPSSTLTRPTFAAAGAHTS